MAQNIPIRFIHNNGDKTEILATDVALDVERKTGGIAIPFAGSTRMGFDFNMNNASIIINGIITDDDVIYTNASAIAASAFVDFSVNQSDAINNFSEYTSWIGSDAKAANIVTYGSTVVTSTTVEGAKNGITLQDVDGNSYTIWFVGHTSVTSSSSGKDALSPDPKKQYWIAVYNTSSSTKATHVEIADNFFDIINNDATLQGLFTATKETSPLTGEANTQIRIKQDTKGESGNKPNPTYTSENSVSGFGSVPYVVPFRGGRGTSAGGFPYSAGDKVMNLYGILNNSDNATIASRLQSSGSESRDIKGQVGAWALDKMGFGSEDKFSDYIIGIQIPYNSMYHGTKGSAGVAKKYAARNFFMPTGASHLPHQKGTRNSEDANVVFNSNADTGDYTGIKGTIQKATFTRLGGEPIWSFTIIFAPIDLIW